MEIGSRFKSQKQNCQLSLQKAQQVISQSQSHQQRNTANNGIVGFSYYTNAYVDNVIMHKIQIFP